MTIRWCWGYAVEAYQSRLMNKDTGSFYILSVDGGGFRGLYAAHILRRMEEEWQPDWKSQFGMLAGTSTGSILVAGLLCGRSAAELSEFYETHGESIFTPRRWSFLDPLKIVRSRYSIARLEKHLDNIFGDTTLGEISTPLILPAVDIGNGCVHVFKSAYDNSFVRDRQVRVAKAVLASCAAPLYFDPIIIGDRYQLADGGIWANNPSLVATIDAHYVEILLDDGSISANGWPKVRETGGRYATIARVFGVDKIDLHIDCDGGCCLGIRHSRENNFRIEKFLCELVIPFFYRLSYIQRFGIQAARRNLWGEYSHGDRGLIEHHKEILGLATGSHGRNRICPCGSGKKYKYCCLAEVEEVRRIGVLTMIAGGECRMDGRQLRASDRTTAIW